MSSLPLSVVSIPVRNFKTSIACIQPITPGDRKTFHSLRQTAIHRCARYAVEHGKSIYLVQAFARHKSPKATLPYFPEIDKAQDPPELWDLDPEEDLSSE